MKTPAKLAAFVGGVAVVFGVGAAAGAAFGPAADESLAAHTTHVPATGRTEVDHGESGHEGATPAGLQASDRGYTLALVDTVLEPGAEVPLRFRILGPDGAPLTAFTPTHEKPLHLIVAGRDLATFAHVHPELGADGAWSTTAPLPAAGTYRVFADFLPAAESAPLTLGADLHLAGEFSPAALPSPSPTAPAGPFTVTVDGHADVGADSVLRFTVAREGAPVTDLDPYLGAAGHLVALRAGDLAYLHVHPEGEGELVFTAHFPTAGAYRLFLDFSVGGRVHTAAFTLVATAHGEVGHDGHNR